MLKTIRGHLMTQLCVRIMHDWRVTRMRRFRGFRGLTGLTGLMYTAVRHSRAPSPLREPMKPPSSRELGAVSLLMSRVALPKRLRAKLQPSLMASPPFSQINISADPS